MKNNIKAGINKMLCGMLALVCATTNLNLIPLHVQAREEQAELVMEKNDQEEIYSETEKLELETQSDENIVETIMHEDKDSEIDNTEETEETLTESKEPRLEKTILIQKVNDCLVEVEGNMPSGVELLVRREMVTQEMKKDIINLSDIVDQNSDFATEEVKLYSYDISLLLDEEEYEPYMFDESVEVKLKLLNLEKSGEIETTEVYHVEDKTKEIELVSIKEKQENQIVFESDRFSQFIILAETTYKGKQQWKYQFSGNRETLEIPTKGIYEISVYGAQGQNSASYSGGKGGFVCTEIALNKNDVIELEVGGQNGFAEGGKGTSTYGGGASKIYLNGELLLLAGGGAGALVTCDGGAGGTLENKVIGSRGESSDKSNSAGGGAGYQGGKAGFVTYHVHKGNQNVKGGCYTKPVYHAHTQECYGIICGHNHLVWEEAKYDAKGDDYSIWYCPGCGGRFVSATTYGEPYTQPTYGWTCKSDGKIEAYDLECGMTEKTIVGAVQSNGGSNFVHTKCETSIVQSGVRNGNGYVEINLRKIDCATIRFENDGHEYKKYQVERGTQLSDVEISNPIKEKDEKYSYEFLGWDQLETDMEECLTAEETIAGNIYENRTFRAIYKRIPREYVITFQTDGNNIGTKNINATYNERLEKVIVPQKEGYIFAGYYKDVEDESTKYFDAYGNPTRNSDFIYDAFLYAKWENPLSIIKDPQNQILTADYSGVLFYIDTKIESNNVYEREYQWYINDKNMVQGAKKIEKGFSNQVILPGGLKVGTYYIFCDVKVNGSVGQYIRKYSKIAMIEIKKGNIGRDNLSLDKNDIIYDGEKHVLQTYVKNDPEAKIYYSNMPLNESNYKQIGSLKPMSFAEAGEYQSYIYVESQNYNNFADKITMTIKKNKPCIYLASKNTVYKEGVHQEIEDAVVLGVNQVPLKNIEVEYTYYLDKEHRQKTSSLHGAKYEGSAPSVIGTYYVCAKTKETNNYVSECTRQDAMLNILGNAVAYSVSDYVGVYDGKEHGLAVRVENKKHCKIYFSDSKELTKENYEEYGKEEPYLFSDAGHYTIYYAVVSDITNQYKNVLCGTAYIQIEKARRELGGKIPTVNPDKTLWIPDGTKWEYREKDKDKDWIEYVTGTKLPDGTYEIRRPEDKNYQSSEPIIIVVTSDNNHILPPIKQENFTGETGGNDSATKPVINDTDKEHKKNLLDERVIITEKDQVLWDWIAQNHKRHKNNGKNDEIKSELISSEFNTGQMLENEIKSTDQDVEQIKLEDEVVAFCDDKENKKEKGVNIKPHIYILTGFIAGFLFFELFLLFFIILLKKKKEKNKEKDK